VFEHYSAAMARNYEAAYREALAAESARAVSNTARLCGARPSYEAAIRPSPSERRATAA